MMSHPSFESLIFERDSLSDAELSLLNEHLADCNACAELSSGWQALAPLMHTSDPITPLDGFTNRWKARLAEDDLARGNRQAWWSLGGFLAGATIVLLLIAAALFSSPIQLAGDLMKTISLIGLQLQLYPRVAVEMVERLPGPSPALWGAAGAAAFAIALASLTVIWVAAWVRFSIYEIPLLEGGN